MSPGGYCGQCGNAVAAGDRFCGNCGSIVPSTVDVETQVIPQPEAVSQSPSGTHRRTLLIAGLVTAMVLLLAATVFSATRSETLMGIPGQEDTPTGGAVNSPEEDAPPPTVQEEQTVYEGGTTSETTSPGYLSASEVEVYEEFGREYADALQDGDWEQTYSMLDETSQEEFTEEEWSEIQQAIQEDEGSPSALGSVTVEPEEGVSDAPVTLTLDYEDGTQDEMTAMIPMAVEAGEDTSPERYLTDEEISELEQSLAPPGGSTTGDLSEGGVEETIRDHYNAIGDNDFQEAYSYFSSGFQSNNPEEGWIEEEESFDIQDSTIYSVEVEDIGEFSATATVDVSFEDNTGNPNFQITWSLVEEGEWRLDEVISS